MNAEDHRDHLIDMLLRELVGGESPPDVRERVLAVAGVSAFRPPAAPRRPRALPKPTPRSRMPVFALAAMIAVLVAGGAALHFRSVVSARTPQLTRVIDSVEREAGQLRAGERLGTDTQSTARLSSPDGTVIELAASGVLEIARRPWWDGSKGIHLLEGRLTAEVTPQEPDAPLVIHAGETRSEVVGTRFFLERDHARTRLEVTEGEVRFVPEANGAAIAVKSNMFAEAGGSGVRSGLIKPPPPQRGILRFTWMNADTDEPLREAPLGDGETLSLASLPSVNLNIRADHEGQAPDSVNITVTRDDGQPTDLPPFASKDQTEPPFFAAGDHWSDGRPNDCRAWTPAPGRYHISATATYTDGETSPPLERSFRITE